MRQLFILIAAICIACLLWPDALPLLRWQRGALTDGEWWRVMSAHFAHLGAWHLVANLVGLGLVIEWLGAAASPHEAALLMLASALAIVVGLMLRDPDIVWYAGMSGIVHGLWAGLAVLGWLRRAYPHRWLPAAALAALLLKLVLWPSSAAGVPVVMQSHLYGALGGALAALLILVGGPAAAARPISGLE